MNESKIELNETIDPAETARCRSQHGNARRNSDWLQSHWPELLPRAAGKFLAIAGEEPFVGDTPADAWDRARAAHPDDDGILCQYVRPERGPRFYANRR